MELTLPYSAYKLVRADGSAAERVDKHPFCMSRVYYDANERPEEVRVQPYFDCTEPAATPKNLAMVSFLSAQFIFPAKAKVKMSARHCA